MLTGSLRCPHKGSKGPSLLFEGTKKILIKLVKFQADKSLMCTVYMRVSLGPLLILLWHIRNDQTGKIFRLLWFTFCHAVAQMFVCVHALRPNNFSVMSE